MTEAIDLVRHFEGCRLSRYFDAAGVPTIGWGHVCKTDQEPVTQHQADVLLDHDLERAAAAVARLLPGCTVTPGQMAALTDFVFNLGALRFQSSTLRRKILAGDDEGAGAEFPKWRMAGGRVLAGLVRRREAERAMFLEAA